MGVILSAVLGLFTLLAVTDAVLAAPSPSADVEMGLPELILTGPRMDFIGAAPGSLALAERMIHYGVPGVSIAVVEDFQLAWAKGYGVLDAETGAPVTPDALFEAASTTKVVTAAAIWSLVAEGRLAFADEAGAHLEGWRLPPSKLAAEEPATLRRLLAHTAGINRPEGGFSVAEGGKPTLVQVLAGEAPALNAPLAIEAVPGSRHAYSNFGYLVLQQLLEDLEGKPFAELVMERVLIPFGMAASTFAPAADVLRARHHGPAGEPLPYSVRHPSALAQGWLWTTPSDLGRLAIAIMVSAQQRPEAPVMAPAVREALQPEWAFAPDEQFGFSGQVLGVFLLGTDKGLGFCHPGQNEPGATCILIGIPATGQAAAVMTNGAQGILLSLEILSSIASVQQWPRILVEEA
ncbi:MAG: class A beta-lactamase-related serine hydrolase, partial [Gemmatimonadales bacterium]